MTNADTDLIKPEGQEPGDWKPEIGPEGKTRLPGLTVVFFVGLCAGGVLCGLEGFWMLRELTKDGVWSYGLEYICMALAVAGIAGAGLAWWAGYGIYERMADAPRRCRILLVVNMVAVAVAIAGIGVIFFDVVLNGDSARDFIMQNNIPTAVSNLLAAIVLSETWRRYFWFSPKVRGTFNLHQPAKNAGNLPPAGIALFTVACWLCPVHYGLSNFVWLVCSWFQIGDGEKLRLLPHAVITTTYFVLPFAALHALHLRRGMLRVIFWCLGLWLAVEMAIWLLNLVNTARLLADMDNYGSGYNYTWGLPRLFSERLFIPLAFWWYFSVSKEARVWFGAERLPWEGEGTRS